MMLLKLVLVAVLGGGITPPNVALDAGHGGRDTGRRFSGVYHGKRVHMLEKDYTCDVVARMIPLLEKSGANVGTTFKAPCLEKPRDFRFSPWPSRAREKFSLTDEVVRRDSAGLLQRDAFASDLFSQFPDSYEAFVSIHFDWDNRNGTGAIIMIPQGCPVSPMATRLAHELIKEGLSRFSAPRLPIVVNGSKGYQDVVILSNAPTCNSMLVEAENAYRLKGRERERDPEMRERWAKIFVRAIIG